MKKTIAITSNTKFISHLSEIIGFTSLCSRQSFFQMIASNPKKMDNDVHTKLISCPLEKSEGSSMVTYQTTGATKDGKFRYLTLSQDGLYFNEVQDGYGYTDRLCLYKLFSKSNFLANSPFIVNPENKSQILCLLEDKGNQRRMHLVVLEIDPEI